MGENLIAHSPSSAPRTDSHDVSSPVCFRLAFGAVLLIGLAARLFVALSPIESSFRLSVPDDAYYYFTMARNTVAGYGPTVDRIAPTNGFHPFWLLALLPFWFIAAGSQSAPVHLALAASALLDMAAALVLFRLALHITSKGWLALAAFAVYSLNPYGIALGVTGLETSLSVLLFGCCLLLTWNWLDNRRPGVDSHQLLRIGLLWGFLVMARTDYAVLAGGMSCYILYINRQRKDSLRAAAVFLLGGIALPVLPWVAWNAMTFGTISQVSGDAYPFYQHTVWLDQNGPNVWALITYEASSIYNVFARISHYVGMGKLLPLVVLVVGGAVAFIPKRERTQILGHLLFPTVLAGAALLYHVLYRWFFQAWYSVPLNYLLALWLTAPLYALSLRGTNHRVAVGLVLLAGLYLYSGLEFKERGGMYPGQIEVLSRDRCEGLSRIGESDSGFSGYFADCVVVNLDGVVNNKAYAAIRNKQFRQYLDSVGLEHISTNRYIKAIVELQEGPISEWPPWH